jgi:hypothetical protein
MAIAQALSVSGDYIDYAQACWTPNTYLNKTRHVFKYGHFGNLDSMSKFVNTHLTSLKFMENMEILREHF